jgi:preprotein translocase subunit SecA
VTGLFERLGRIGARLPDTFYDGLRWLAQFRAERRNREIRMQNLHHDRRLDRVLAFSGRGE